MSPKAIKDTKARTASTSERALAADQLRHERSGHMSLRDFLDIIEGGAKVAAAILTAPVLQGRSTGGAPCRKKRLRPCR